MARERERRAPSSSPSEDRFRAAFAQSPVGLELYDAEGKLWDANPACLALFGLRDVRPVIGFDLFADPNLPDHAKARVLGGESIKFELGFDFDLVKEKDLYATTRSGTCDIECFISSQHDSAGRLSGYVVAVTDISERKRTERALKQSEQRFRTVFDGAPVGIAVVDSSTGRFVNVNETYCKIVGYSRQEMLALHFAEITHPDDVGSNVEHLHRLRRGEFQVYSTEKRYIRKDGSTVWVALRVVALPGRAGDLDSHLTIVEDITERKNAEGELRRYAERLAEANRVKDLFTDILRHDIMNPTSAIGTAAEVLVLLESEEKKRRLLDVIRRSTRNLAEMAANAAKYARLASAEGVDLDFARLDLNATLRTVLGDFELALKEKELSVEFAPSNEVLADLNPMVKDVFANLISNAIKYSPPRRTIGIDVQDGGDSWRIAVRDSGEGIADENKERVFDRFERVGKGGVKGSGLGLAIARHIVNAHGGRIWIEDNRGGGCVFCVTLPKTRPAAS